MKRISIVVAAIALIITAGICSFDQSRQPSQNNEGLVELPSLLIKDSIAIVK